MPKKNSPKLTSQVVLEMLEENKSKTEEASAYDVHPDANRVWMYVDVPCYFNYRFVGLYALKLF